MEKRSLKVVFVSDPGTGSKTSLINRYMNGVFSPTFQTIGIGGVHRVTLEHDKETASLMMWDMGICIFSLNFFSTGGVKSEFEKICDFVVKDCFAFVLGFDITRRVTFENIMNWYSTIRLVNEKYSQHSEVILVGNKCDLSSERKVSREEAEYLAKSVGFQKYFETSSKTGHNVNNVMKFLGERSIATLRLREHDSEIFYTEGYKKAQSASIMSPGERNEILRSVSESIEIKNSAIMKKKMSLRGKHRQRKRTTVSQSVPHAHVINHGDGLGNEYEGNSFSFSRGFMQLDFNQFVNLLGKKKKKKKKKEKRKMTKKENFLDKCDEFIEKGMFFIE